MRITTIFFQSSKLIGTWFNSKLEYQRLFIAKHISVQSREKQTLAINPLCQNSSLFDLRGCALVVAQIDLTQPVNT